MSRFARSIVAAAFGVCAAQAGAATCSVSAVSLAFGSYNQFQGGHTDSAGNIAVTCSGLAGEAVAYTIALNAGTGGFTPRQLRSASGFPLNYNIYNSAARVTVWGDGTSGTVVVADSYTLGAPSVMRNYAVFGRVFAGQKMPVGVYTDSIVVTLNF